MPFHFKSAERASALFGALHPVFFLCTMSIPQVGPLFIGEYAQGKEMLGRTG